MPRIWAESTSSTSGAVRAEARGARRDPAAGRGAGAVVRTLRGIIRALQTKRTSPSVIERVARAVVMVPPFALMLIILRTRARRGRPIEVTARTADGSRFRCHPPDLVQMYLWLFDIWEPDLTSYVTSELRPGDTFVDVGANIGYYAIVAAKRARPNGKVVAIEASPAIFSHLAETIVDNGLEHEVRCANVAAAAERGTLTLYSGPRHNIGLTTTVRSSKSRSFEEECVVSAVPVGEILKAEERRSVRFVKVDVEGAEPEVLRGIRELFDTGREDLELIVELSPTWWSDESLRPIDVLRPFLNAGMHAYELENNLWPWRYLWPRRVRRPVRCERDLTRRVDRLDLVLSPRDVREL